MSYSLKILGCGSSAGVPRVGNDWGKCDPQNPKNRRRRCSALVERRSGAGVTRVLVDTSPDLREQLLGVRVGHLDGVLYTHDHADHTHGIDDLRMISYAMKKRVSVWMDQVTGQGLRKRFEYCFKMPDGQHYPPILKAHKIVPPTPVIVEGKGGNIAAVPIQQEHGDIASLGFRFNDVAYSPDISGLPEASAELLRGLDVWIVDALREAPHPSHFSVGQALEWITELKPKRAILTHLHVDLDYAMLAKKLPAGVCPAYDGLEISC